MAVLDEDYADGFVAPLKQNTNNQTIPEERGRFSRINWSDVGSQIGKELTRQLTNTCHLIPGVFQQSQVKKTQLPTVVIEVPKQSDQQTMEQNNGSETTCEVTTAVRSECELPGNLAPVVRKPINANPRLNRQNPRSKFILRLNSVPRRPISTIQGLN